MNVTHVLARTAPDAMIAICGAVSTVSKPLVFGIASALVRHVVKHVASNGQEKLLLQLPPEHTV